MHTKTLAASFVGAGVLALAIVWRVVTYPYFYLQGDSYTYFVMVRHVYDAGLLFSYSGIDHTTGVHPGWYLFLIPFYPLFRMAFPIGVLVLGAAMVIAGAWALWRAVGPIPACVVFVAAFTPYGFRLVDNGMESTLLFLCLCLLTLAYAGFSPRECSDRRALLLGLALGSVVFARLDSVFLVAALFLVLVFERTRIRTLALVALPVVLIIGLVFALDLHYGGSLLPISGGLKSSFPHLAPGVVDNLASFKIFPLAILALGAYLAGTRRRLGSLISALLLACIGLYAYDVLFVSGTGQWYGTLAFFALVLALGLTAGELAATWQLPLVRLAPLLPLALALVLAWHLTLMGPDWITPEITAAQYLNAHAQPGEAAAEFKDGIVAFYATALPVYNLPGLANNEAYVDALRQGKMEDYLASRHIEYIIGGSAESGIQVPGAQSFSCSGVPLYDDGIADVFPVSECR